MAKGRTRGDGGRRNRAREAAALRAGRIFREVTDRVSGPVREHIANILGGPHAFDLRATSAATRGKVNRIRAEKQKAAELLHNLFKERGGKIPPEIIVQGKRLIDWKNEILAHILDPQGEIQITSFDELRKFFKDKGLCLSEGRFRRIFEDMFNEEEERIISRIFPQRNPKGNPIGRVETRFDWFAIKSGKAAA